MWDKVAELLLSQGFGGLALMVMGAVIWYLITWVRELLKDKSADAEKRIAERDSVITALIKATAAMESVTDAIEANNRVVAALQTELQFRRLNT